MSARASLFNRTPAGAGAGVFNPENLGPDAIRLVGNLCFALFVSLVVVFTILAATYEPDDPLLHPSSTDLTSFLTSTSNATFSSDSSSVVTGEDLSSPNSSIPIPFIHLSDITTDVGASPTNTSGVECDVNVECGKPEVFHLMMRAAIETFSDIHFYRFGKPVAGENETTCDMAWRFRPKDPKRAALYKDYRRFVLGRTPECELKVESIGEYHTGVNARKRRRRKHRQADPGFEVAKKENGDGNENSVESLVSVPVVGDAVNDTLPVVESEGKFSAGRYLVYTGGGERCKSMDHYMWSFLCALGEAQYLNRTLVMDLSVCLSSVYSTSGRDEEGKDFRFYFDFEHLKESASVLDQRQFWTDWGMWEKKDGLTLNLVEDFRVTPMKLADAKDTLIMRKFGNVEPDNYWYRVCEGETESVIQRPWHLMWKSRRLLEIVSGIASKMNWDFDSVHVVRGEKARNTALWPNLAADTSPDALLATLGDKIDDGRTLYIATDERDTSLFSPLKDKYNVHFLDHYNELWGENSEWYAETKQLNNGVPVEFDGYMRSEVDTEVFLRGKKQLETFNDLTSDCKDGINTCKTAAS